jgi:anhydro-N-acetylmuramic acid kinase
MSKGLYIGIMSGTSLDGIDVALCSIDEHSCLLEASLFMPFDNSLKEDILSIIDTSTTVKQIGEIDHRLAHAFAKGVNALLKKENLQARDIIAIGSHGQTLWHEPNGEYPFSMQLGNPSVLAVETAIDVVADFRAKDIAMGGQGAPFAPAFHQFLFSDIKSCAVLNIGGMANITVFEPELIGYDVGCGNVLMDMWVLEHKNLPYDKDGNWAKSGKVHDELLKSILNDEYFNLKYPKSTGREYFNKKFLINYLEPFGKISHEDIQATLLAVTVHAVANEVKKFNIKELLLCGGGAKNIFLMSQLQKLLPKVDIKKTDDYNVKGDDLEAMIFAWFAYMRLEKRAVELKSVTGAKRSTILGGLYAKS